MKHIAKSTLWLKPIRQIHFGLCAVSPDQLGRHERAGEKTGVRVIMSGEKLISNQQRQPRNDFTTKQCRFYQSVGAISLVVIIDSLGYALEEPLIAMLSSLMVLSSKQTQA